MKRIIVYVVLVFLASSSGKAKVEEELANRIQEINRLEDIVAESHSKIIELTSAIESINADLDNCYGKSKQFQNSTDWLLNDSDWGTLVFYGRVINLDKGVNVSIKKCRTIIDEMEEIIDNCSSCWSKAQYFFKMEY